MLLSVNNYDDIVSSLDFRLTCELSVIVGEQAVSF